jgi:hypothetical protein
MIAPSTLEELGETIWIMNRAKSGGLRDALGAKFMGRFEAAGNQDRDPPKEGPWREKCFSVLSMKTLAGPWWCETAT